MAHPKAIVAAAPHLCSPNDREGASPRRAGAMSHPNLRSRGGASSRGVRPHSHSRRSADDIRGRGMRSMRVRKLQAAHR